MVVCALKFRTIAKVLEQARGNEEQALDRGRNNHRRKDRTYGWPQIHVHRFGRSRYRCLSSVGSTVIALRREAMLSEEGGFGERHLREKVWNS